MNTKEFLVQFKKVAPEYIIRKFKNHSLRLMCHNARLNQSAGFYCPITAVIASTTGRTSNNVGFARQDGIDVLGMSPQTVTDVINAADNNCHTQEQHCLRRKLQNIMRKYCHQQ